MKRLADWIGGALSGVFVYRLWKRWQEPEAFTPPEPAVPDDRAEELRAKLAETRASEEPAEAEPAEEPDEESLEERRRRVHEEGRAAIDEMRGD